jgi:four helix bundle protein
MHNFRKLDVWKESMVFVKSIYEVTIGFPKAEQYGLTSQLNRAVVSIPTNIAEGAGRGTDLDFARFLAIANGSAYETETLLRLAISLELIVEEEIAQLLDDLDKIQKKIFQLRNSVLRKAQG